MVRICVSPKWMQEETVKAKSRFRHMHGHYIVQRYGQVLLRGTGRYEVIDFVAVLFGYAVSGERWKPFMSTFSPGQMRSWHSSGEITCQHARRSAAFSPRWIRQQSSRCAPCFSKTCWRALWKKRSSSAGCSTGRGTTTSFSMWMARVRRLAKAPYRRLRIGQLPRGVCAPCAPPATPDASEGRWCGAVPRSCRPTRISFWARLETLATDPYRAELGRAVTAIQSYRETHHHPEKRVLLRLDG